MDCSRDDEPPVELVSVTEVTGLQWTSGQCS